MNICIAIESGIWTEWNRIAWQKRAYVCIFNMKNSQTLWYFYMTETAAGAICCGWNFIFKLSSSQFLPLEKLFFFTEKEADGRGLKINKRAIDIHECTKIATNYFMRHESQFVYLKFANGQKIVELRPTEKWIATIGQMNLDSSEFEEWTSTDAKIVFSYTYNSML